MHHFSSSTLNLMCFTCSAWCWWSWTPGRTLHMQFFITTLPPLHYCLCFENWLGWRKETARLVSSVMSCYYGVLIDCLTTNASMAIFKDSRDGKQAEKSSSAPERWLWTNASVCWCWKLSSDISMINDDFNWLRCLLWGLLDSGVKLLWKLN